MYARVTRYKFNAEGVSKITEINNEIEPQIMKIPGAKHWSSLMGEDGQAMVVVVYENEAAATAAIDTVKGLWGSVMQYLDGPPEAPEVYNVYGLKTEL